MAKKSKMAKFILQTVITVELNPDLKRPTKKAVRDYATRMCRIDKDGISGHRIENVTVRKEVDEQ